MDSPLKFPFYAKASLVFIGLFALISMLFIAQKIIVPIIYSTVIAIVLSPVVDFFVKKKMHRLIAISITLILVILFTASVIALLSAQVMQFSDSLPVLVRKFHLMIDQIVAWGSRNFHISTYKIKSWLDEKSDEILSGPDSNIGQTIITTGSVLVILVLIPVYIFMILYYQTHLLEFIHRLFRSTNKKHVNEIITATKKIIRSYLVGLLLEAAIIAVLNSTCLLILGIDYAILLGIIGAIVNVIPYIGGIVAVALPMIVSLATKTPSYSLLILGSYILIQFTDNHFIIPKVVASKVKLNALVALIVVLAGGALWGIPGMFLSIPLTAIIKVIFDHITPLKPWGFLLGNSIPDAPKVTLKKMEVELEV